MSARPVAALLALALLPCGMAGAHSASDAFLTLHHVSPPGGAVVLEGQWDIALRDLDFVLHLDADGDGRITWGEVRKRQADIVRFAFSGLRARTQGADCAIAPLEQRVAGYPDGAYAALFFRVTCKAAAARVTLDYRLLFDVDPTHRGILVLRDAGATGTALLSPEQPRATFDLAPRRSP